MTTHDHQSKSSSETSGDSELIFTQEYPHHASMRSQSDDEKLHQPPPQPYTQSYVHHHSSTYIPIPTEHETIYHPSQRTSTKFQITSQPSSYTSTSSEQKQQQFPFAQKTVEHMIQIIPKTLSITNTSKNETTSGSASSSTTESTTSTTTRTRNSLHSYSSTHSYSTSDTVTYDSSDEESVTELILTNPSSLFAPPTTIDSQTTTPVSSLSLEFPKLYCIQSSSTNGKIINKENGIKHERENSSLYLIKGIFIPKVLFDMNREAFLGISITDKEHKHKSLALKEYDLYFQIFFNQLINKYWMIFNNDNLQNEYAFNLYVYHRYVCINRLLMCFMICEVLILSLIQLFSGLKYICKIS